MFFKDYLSDPAFIGQPLAHDGTGPVLEPEHGADGASYMENGDIEIKLHAPNTEKIELKIIGSKCYSMNKGEDGTFTFTIPYDPYRNGPLTTDFYFDGNRLLSPFLPVYYSSNNLHNYLEFPDENQDFAYLKDVPHGSVSQQFYYSHVHDRLERCFVYTPPGYMNNDKSYPVLYLQHGGGENETVWETTGRISCILDNLIAKNACVPFIVVMNNDMLRYPGNEGGPFDHGFEKMLIEECIPYIDSTFRTKADKWSRAIAGLSMGSYLTCDIALFHPDMFGYYCALTGTLYQRPDMALYERPYIDNEKCGKIFCENYRVFFQSATPQEDHLNYCLIDNQLCRDNGVADLPGYRFIIHDEHTTKWSSWRMGIRDFACLIFREKDAYHTKEALRKYEYES